MQRPILIAEIGTSHGGDLTKARELIAAASEAGADAAKFQLVFADEILHPKSGVVELPGGRIPLYDRFKALEQPIEFYATLKEETESHGLTFVCSPFGIRSARILREIGTRVFKIASPELNHYPLLEEVASYGNSTILSTGVSTLGDIEMAVSVVSGRNPLYSDRGGASDGAQEKTQKKVLVFPALTLLHCITSYPAPEEEYNLSLIPNLRGIFGVPVGVSDHSLDPVLVPVLAVLEKARIVEKHFTLDRKGEGLDDPIALVPKEFAQMALEVRSAFLELQAGRRGHVVEALEARYGKERVYNALGDGVKRLARSEEENYRTTNRSIHAMRELKGGEILDETNCALLRTEKTLRPGLPPELWNIVLGKRLVRPVPDGEGITWEDVLG
ncbi:MAG TPA: N-acetylneuraminate synthase family protein [Spirochaetales bacterium]|nr:N-acetylneuraminate synthase family protein [Spirochaetales bacterium]